MQVPGRLSPQPDTAELEITSAGTTNRSVAGIRSAITTNTGWECV
jgi:hypothetical protein